MVVTPCVGAGGWSDEVLCGFADGFEGLATVEHVGQLTDRVEEAGFGGLVGPAGGGGENQDLALIGVQGRVLGLGALKEDQAGVVGLQGRARHVGGQVGQGDAGADAVANRVRLFQGEVP